MTMNGLTGTTMKELTGRHVLMALFGFFGMMLLANGIFLYFAVSTFNGLDNPNAYQDGLNYNARIEASRQQAALGWAHEVTLTPDGRLGLSVKDGSRNAVSGLKISGTIGRPASDRFTRELDFHETAPGVYAAQVSGIESGNWIAALTAAETGSGAEVIYRMKERLWLKPN
jgi:nitrogen fixation protein FixH